MNTCIWTCPGSSRIRIHVLDCHDQTLKELRQLREAGITRILDVTNIGMGRDLDLLRRLEAESGVTIVRSTGFYKDPFIPAEWQDATAEEMAATMVRDIQEGNAAVIGEVGTSRNEWTDNEQKLFDAALLAHQATGAPIYTHTTLGTLALEQAKFLTEHGADPKRSSLAMWILPGIWTRSGRCWIPG